MKGAEGSANSAPSFDGRLQEERGLAYNRTVIDLKYRASDSQSGMYSINATDVQRVLEMGGRRNLVRYSAYCVPIEPLSSSVEICMEEGYYSS